MLKLIKNHITTTAEYFLTEEKAGFNTSKISSTTLSTLKKKKLLIVWHKVAWDLKICRKEKPHSGHQSILQELSKCSTTLQPTGRFLFDSGYPSRVLLSPVLLNITLKKMMQEALCDLRIITVTATMDKIWLSNTIWFTTKYICFFPVSSSSKQA